MTKFWLDEPNSKSWKADDINTQKYRMSFIKGALQLFWTDSIPVVAPWFVRMWLSHNNLEALWGHVTTMFAWLTHTCLKRSEMTWHAADAFKGNIFIPSTRGNHLLLATCVWESRGCVGMHKVIEMNVQRPSINTHTQTRTEWMQVKERKIEINRGTEWMDA